MSRYYVSPLGTVLDSVLPSAVRKRVGLGYSQMVRLAQDRGQVQALLEKTKAAKRRAILARLLLVEPGESIELTRLAGEAGATAATVRKLVRSGLITITPEADLAGLTQGMGSAAGGETDLTLNAEQQTTVDALLPRVRDGGFSVNLLMGVTGSGKTEVYLRCIREAIDRGKRAIVLVPEIALTPQTARRFTARFPNVAVLHSGLTATDRHRFWQQASTGHAQVVVGARSAVFAPTPDLGIIVVDEEHEASYKQDSAPRYHARDVAIKRRNSKEFQSCSAAPRHRWRCIGGWWKKARRHEGTKARRGKARRHEGTEARRVRKGRSSQSPGAAPKLSYCRQALLLPCLPPVPYPPCLRAFVPPCLPPPCLPPIPFSRCPTGCADLNWRMSNWST